MTGASYWERAICWLTGYLSAYAGRRRQLRVTPDAEAGERGERGWASDDFLS